MSQKEGSSEALSPFSLFFSVLDYRLEEPDIWNRN